MKHQKHIFKTIDLLAIVCIITLFTLVALGKDGVLMTTYATATAYYLGVRTQPPNIMK